MYIHQVDRLISRRNSECHDDQHSVGSQSRGVMVYFTKSPQFAQPNSPKRISQEGNSRKSFNELHIDRNFQTIYSTPIKTSKTNDDEDLSLRKY